MELLWSIACESSSIDKDSNKLSLFNIVDSIGFSPPDADIRDEDIGGLPLRMVVVTLWRRSNLDIEETSLQRIFINNPDSKPIGPPSPTMKIDLTRTNQRFQARFNLAGFPYTGTGTYHIVIQRQQNEDWETVNMIPIEVARLSPE